jgi:hypothetical protein
MAAYYNAHEPAAEALVGSPGVRTVGFDVTAMVAGWLADPGAPQRGQFMTLAGDGPARITWQTGGPSLAVTTTSAESLEPQPVYFLVPTPLLPEHSAVLGFERGAAVVVVSEIHYHPAAPTPGELAAAPGSGPGEFEFLELLNVSDAAIDLSGATFADGVDFEVPQGVSLAPGARAVVAGDLVAFAARYGTLDPPPAVLGAFGGNLDNAGEFLRLESADGDTLAEFRYDDQAPWPSSADGDGYSLTYACPDPDADPAVATNWRTSVSSGGTPGYDDSVTFAEWAASEAVTGGENGDHDSDGLPNLIEFALPAPGDPAPAPSPTLHVSPPGAGRENETYVQFFRRAGARVGLGVEVSDDLVGWVGLADVSLVGSVRNAGGGVEEVVLRVPVEGGSAPGSAYFRLTAVAK